LIAEWGAVILALDETKEVYTSTAAINTEMSTLLGEIEVVTGLIQKLVNENGASAQNQDYYTQRNNDLVTRYETTL